MLGANNSKNNKATKKAMGGFAVAVAVLLIALFFSGVSWVSAHSWVACTDYREKDGYYFNKTKCQGWPRQSTDAVYNQPWAQNMGYQSTSPTCRAHDVNPPYPLASYARSELICLAWSAQNHVNCAGKTGCNIWLPDNGVIVESQPLAGGEWSLVADFGKSSKGFEFVDTFPRAGFQNCPNFDPSGPGRVFNIGDQSVRAFCSQCFRVPADMAPGDYVFRWTWEFNPGEKYYTCWDAKVRSGGARVDPTEFVVPGSSPTEPPVPATTARPLITTRPPNVVTTNHPANVPTTRPLSKQTTRSLRRTTRKLTTQSPVPGTTSIKLLFNRQGSSGYGFSGEISMQNLGAQVVDGYTIQWRVKDGYDQSQPGWVWNCGTYTPPSPTNGNTAACNVPPGRWNSKIPAGQTARTIGMYVSNKAGKSSGNLADATENWKVVVDGKGYSVAVPETVSHK